MADLEVAFAEVERTAGAAAKAAKTVARQAEAVAKAARGGDIAGIKRAQKELDEARSAFTQEVLDAVASWPLNDEEEMRLLDEEYAGELQRAGAAKGLTMHEHDGALICSPSIVRIISAERAVRIDHRKVSTLRPSHLVGLLLKNQRRSSGFSSKRFLDCLYSVYTDIVSGNGGGRDLAGANPVVLLARIYRLMTALPGTSRDYGLRDFARDLYLLDSQGPKQTKNGATISFPASTGTKQHTNERISFVDSDGYETIYFGVRFDKDHD